MAAFGLVVHFHLKPGHDEAFDALTAETVAAIETHEPGTLVYATHTVPDEPQTRVFYELYRDHAAFETHEAQPHTRRFLTEREQHLDSHSVIRLTGGPASVRGQA